VDRWEAGGVVGLVSAETPGGTPDTFQHKAEQCFGGNGGDGVGDNVDKCPDVVGPKENEGCPDVDADGDGIKDKEDKCPQTPGDKTNDGCPKITDKDAEIVNEVQDKLKFNGDGAEIKPLSYETLELFANWMNANKAIVKLKGHTSNEKSESISLALSKERVEAVRKYLMAKNVNPTRIDVEYFGSAKPVADNNTAEGREKNNRVEFEISFR
jgi:outer membrane protein OmpA-like peptidoglycan-associated protein